MFENCQKHVEQRRQIGRGVHGVIVATKAKKWGQGIDGSVCPSLLPLSFSPFVAAGREKTKRINTL